MQQLKSMIIQYKNYFSPVLIIFLKLSYYILLIVHVIRVSLKLMSFENKQYQC